MWFFRPDWGGQAKRPDAPRVVPGKGTVSIVQGVVRMDLEITLAAGLADMEEARQLFVEYANSPGIELVLEGSEEEQWANLPEAYVAPLGQLLLARVRGQVVACLALWSLTEETGELKRLYVRPAYRRLGIARRLIEAMTQLAPDLGYRQLRLEMRPGMAATLRLTPQRGFRAVGASSEKQVEGAAFFELSLA